MNANQIERVLRRIRFGLGLCVYMSLLCCRLSCEIVIVCVLVGKKPYEESLLSLLYVYQTEKSLLESESE